jgi:hypothetical protein
MLNDVSMGICMHAVTGEWKWNLRALWQEREMGRKENVNARKFMEKISEVYKVQVLHGLKHVQVRSVTE